MFGPALVCPGLGCSASITLDDVRRVLLGTSSNTTTKPETDANALWASFEAAYTEAKEVLLLAKHSSTRSTLLTTLLIFFSTNRWAILATSD